MNTLIIRFIHTTIYSHNMSIWISVSASPTRKIKGKELLNRHISILIKFPNKLWCQLSHHIIQHQQRTVNVDSVNEQKIIIVITWTQFWVSFKLKASSYFAIIMLLKNTMATLIITTSFKEMHSSRKFLTTKNNKTRKENQPERYYEERLQSTFCL